MLGMTDADQSDWVAARAECTAVRLFGALRRVVNRDVEAANKSPHINCGFSVKPRDLGDASFDVLKVVSTAAGFEGRRFILSGETITVAPVDARDVVHDALLKAEPHLDLECRCLLRYTVPAEPGANKTWQRIEPQQFSRLALEGLFFPKR